ncbi:uncharacterized protein TNCV_2132261 [Trichonephila clavipes]|nr:uncharacterized protein TNCV_2132261 [Trichonephila clavipes]
MTGEVLTPISGFHHTKGDKNQWPNNNPGYVQTELILGHVSHLKAGHIPRFKETRKATRGLLATDHVILNHGQVMWTTPELAPPLLTTTPHQREDVSALDRFNVHRFPTRATGDGPRNLSLSDRDETPITTSLNYRTPPMEARGALVSSTE